MRITLLGLILLLLGPGHQVAAQGLEIPRLTGRVVDRAGILSRAEQHALSVQLERFAKQKGPQFAVLILPSLEGEVIEQFSIRVVDQWKLGNEKRDDGLLLLVALADRKIRIEVGQGLEGDIPDAYAARVIDNVMAPAFRQGNLAGGIQAGLAALVEKLGGKLEPVVAVRQQRSRHRRTSGCHNIFFTLFILSVLGGFFRGGRGGRRGRRRLGGMMLFGPAIGSSWGGGGFSSGGFSGGGFSGGGGGFSGGGASGGW